MGREKVLVGSRGERIAAALLKRRGYRVIASNYRTPLGEIDLITRQRGVIVFVEVKTRTGPSLGPPFLSVTWKKQRHIVRAALVYLKERGLCDAPWRIDVVSVRLNAAMEAEDIEVIENAVEDMQ